MKTRLLLPLALLLLLCSVAFAQAIDPTADPGGTVTALSKLYHSGSWLCLGIVGAFALLELAESHVAWLQVGNRKHVATAVIGGLGVLVVPATQGTTPNMNMLVIAGGTFWALCKQGAAPSSPPAKAAQGGFVRLSLLVVIAALLGGALALNACGPSAREKTISTTLTATNAACSAFVAFDAKHQQDIVAQAGNRTAGEAALSSWRDTQLKVEKGCTAAYQTIAVAATANDDQTLAGMVSAVLLLKQELTDLGVIK